MINVEYTGSSIILDYDVFNDAELIVQPAANEWYFICFYIERTIEQWRIKVKSGYQTTCISVIC